jgi:regulator of protease activity HflC (stomatin/prohibitin superfamily)
MNGPADFIPAAIAGFLVVLMVAYLFLIGQAVPPDKLVLTVNYIGERKVEDEKHDRAVASKNSLTLLGRPVTATVKIGSRAPRNIPGVRRSFVFPLGVTSLVFSEDVIPESPSKTGFKLPVKGSFITVDTVFNMEIMWEEADVVQRLLKLLTRYQTISTYTARDHLILQKLAQGIFRSELRQAFARQTAGRNIKYVANNKTEINEGAQEWLNTKFNPFGIHFSLAAISSDVALNQEQQRKMNMLVALSAENEVQEDRNKRYLPKKETLIAIKEEGRTAAQQIEVDAKINAAALVAAAEKQQILLLKGLLGEDAGKLKEFLTLYQSQPKRPIHLVPNGTRLILGNNPTIGEK